VVIEFAVRSVGESIGDVSVDVGEGDGASSAVEVVSPVGSVGLFPDEPKARVPCGLTTDVVKPLNGL
jgi:hypothetical protein